MNYTRIGFITLNSARNFLLTVLSTPAIMMGMSLDVAGHQTEGYRISTDVYEGPLDLLLELIEKAELDITKLALAQVTDQYLAYLNQIQDQSAAEVSAFLVIAAKLIQIKSEALLPRPPEREPGEEDPGEALAQQLLIYKQFKRISGWLTERFDSGLRTYQRVAPPPKVEGRIDLTGIGLTELIQAALTAFAMDQDKPFLSNVVNIPRVTIRDRIRYIIGYVRQSGTVSFHTLLSESKTRTDVVVTFLAMLELIKRHYLEAEQVGLFSDIQLQPIADLSMVEEFDLEFSD